MRLLISIFFSLIINSLGCGEEKPIIREVVSASDSCETQDDCQDGRWCVEGVCERPCYYQFTFYGTTECKAEGETCENHWECDTVFCNEGICTNSCGDGIKNGEEAGVDCGGYAVHFFPECTACQNGTSCISDGDCGSRWCRNGTCDNCRDSDDCPYGYQCTRGQCQ